MALAALLLLVTLALASGCAQVGGIDSGARCPKCGSGNVVPIEYGLPGPEMRAGAERGEIVLGGCVVSDDSAIWHCKDCQSEWGRFKENRLSPL